MGFERNYFTYKFVHDHVELLGANDDIRAAKKKAERRYQDRDVAVNTLVCLWPRDLIRLVGEIASRQEEYAANPTGLFTSEAVYSYYEREGKRAKRYSPRRFKYGVRREDGSTTYKMHHLHHMI